MKLVSGRGREECKVMLIFDYATDDDVRNGEALTGSAEQCLSQMLRDVGIRYSDCYKTLLVKEKLSYYGKNQKKLREAIAKADASVHPRTYKELLAEEIEQIKPNVIVPLSEQVFRYLTNETHILKFRGSILPLIPEIQSKIVDKTIRVIPTLGPYYIFQDYAHKPYVALDLAKVKDCQDRQDEIKHPGLLWICNTVDSFRAFVNRNKDAEFMTFDIETFMNIPTCISFCFDGYEAISVPLFQPDVDSANAILLLYEVAALLASDIPKVNQNIKYDTLEMERFGFKVNNIVGDTMLRASLIYPELPKGLDFLTSIYTHIPYYKDDGKEAFTAPNRKQQLFIYNAKDALATHQVYTGQQEDLEELHLAEFEQELMMPWFFIYKSMDEIGIRVDATQKAKLIAKYQTLRDFNDADYRSLIDGEEFAIGSPMQNGKLLYEVIKFPVRYKVSQGGQRNYNTEEEVLEELMILNGENNKYGEKGKRIIECIVADRKFKKILQYINIPIHPDGRLRTSYKLHGTETGRTSGGKSADYILEFNERRRIKKTKQNKVPNYGGSFQTLPKHGFKIRGKQYGKDLRSMYVPTHGYVFVEADLSQAEARVDAVLATDWDMLPKFDIAPGIHALTASWVYNCDPWLVREKKKAGDDEMYQMGKTVRHAAERNMQAKTLALMTHEPLGVCEVLLNKFHSTQPKIRGVFHKEIMEFVTHNMVLRAPNGRVRQFFGRKDHKLYNEAISTLPQAVVTDQTKTAMVRTAEEIGNEVHFHYVYEGHDAAMAEVRKGEEMAYARCFKKWMEREIDFEGCSLSRDYALKIPAEVMIGRENWMDMEVIEPE